jgi:hypothetical protein
MRKIKSVPGFHLSTFLKVSHSFAMTNASNR